MPIKKEIRILPTTETVDVDGTPIWNPSSPIEELLKKSLYRIVREFIYETRRIETSEEMEYLIATAANSFRVHATKILLVESSEQSTESASEDGIF
jgi:hypothetical protein